MWIRHLLLKKSFQNNKTFDVNLIFGKTLNQSMLRCFFDPKEAECKPLFKDLEISKDKEFCDKFQNKVPVIFMTFKDTKWNDKNMFTCLSTEYIRHYDAKNYLDTETEKERFESFVMCKASEDDTDDSASLLSKAFYN